MSNDGQNRNVADQHRIESALLTLRRASAYARRAPAPSISAREIDPRWLLDNIFALELLLKGAALISTLVRSESALACDYLLLWKALPEETRRQVRLLAQSKLAGADLGDVTQYLVAYQFVFFKSREFYVRDGSVASAESVSMSSSRFDAWREINLPKVRYFPEQLIGLIYGLSSFIEARLTPPFAPPTDERQRVAERGTAFRRPRFAPLSRRIGHVNPVRGPNNA